MILFIVIVILGESLIRLKVLKNLCELIIQSFKFPVDLTLLLIEILLKLARSRCFEGIKDMGMLIIIEVFLFSCFRECVVALVEVGSLGRLFL